MTVYVERVADLTEKQRRELDACPRCGSIWGFPCFDRRYKPQPHLTPVPTKHRHRERT